MNAALLLKLYFHIREFSFFSAKIFFSSFFFKPHSRLQLPFEVSKRRGGKLIGLRADCKYVCLPPAVAL